MATPRYLLTEMFFKQLEHTQSKSASGTSLSGRMYVAGEEVDWEAAPTWFMEPVNSEARAMIEKYPPIDPMSIDDMIDRAPSMNDAHDQVNMKARASLDGSRDMQVQPVIAATKRRGRRPKQTQV